MTALNPRGIALEPAAGFRQTRGVRLDRMLDAHGIAVCPFAVCDVRRGVRLELAPMPETHMHCVLAGEGALQIADEPAIWLVPGMVAIVPANVAHGFVPRGGGARLVSLRSLGNSDRMPTVVAGDGEAGLLFVSGRVRIANGAPSPFDRVLMPLAIDLSDAPFVGQTFAALLAEQERCSPGRRHMTELLMTQCMIRLLRELPTLWAPGDSNAARAL